MHGTWPVVALSSRDVSLPVSWLREVDWLSSQSELWGGENWDGDDVLSANRAPQMHREPGSREPNIPCSSLCSTECSCFTKPELHRAFQPLFSDKQFRFNYMIHPYHRVLRWIPRHSSLNTAPGDSMWLLNWDNRKKRQTDFLDTRNITQSNSLIQNRLSGRTCLVRKVLTVMGVWGTVNQSEYIMAVLSEIQSEKTFFMFFFVFIVC